MPSFKKQQLIAASDLRTTSQRDLFRLLNDSGKLGIIYKENLSAVLLTHERYEMLLTRINELETELKHANDSDL